MAAEFERDLLPVFPQNLVPGELRVANLVITQLAAGAMMALTGAWQARLGRPVLRINRFACAYPFALAMALVGSIRCLRAAHFRVATVF